MAMPLAGSAFGQGFGAALRALMAVAALLGTAPLAAQEAGSITVPSPILTLDQERLFAESQWGRRFSREIEAASAALAAENRRIEATLTAEERALTERRATMTPEDFRAAADEFDARVETIRAEQDTKTRDLGLRRDQERQKFFAAVFPELRGMLLASGAVAILDARALFLAIDAIDVTDELIARIDAVHGEGLVAPDLAPVPAPQPAPETAP